MTVITAEERVAFQDAARRLMADHSTEADVRRTMETSEGYDPSLWKQLAEIGIIGLAIPEDFGGVGAGPVELELVMEEAGAALLCSPLLSSGVLAAGLLKATGDADAQERLLPAIADGTTIATVALTGPAGTWTADGVAVTSADGVLTGEADFVTHGQVAGLLLVLARDADGLSIYEVDAKAAGVAISALPAFDRTLRLAKIAFDGAKGRKISSNRPAWACVEDALNLARVALAGEQAGGGKKVVEFTVDYVKNRIQFGRAIGSFQAVKHMAADILLESESAVSAARAAAKALADGAPDADAQVSLAAFACADAYSFITATAIQMHGGIAFTWAHPAHLYLRRARSAAQLFGAPAYYRERYIQQLGG